MDKATKEWMLTHRDKLGSNILEIGSLNVNGALREVIPVTVGVDMREGNGVDLVCKVEDLPDHFNGGCFDSCVSAGTLEHVEDWKSFIRVTWDLVKEGGYLVMTMASPKKLRHAYPDDYWRLTLDQVKEIYPSAEWVGDVGKPSIGWVAKKEGSLGNLDKINPQKVI